MEKNNNETDDRNNTKCLHCGKILPENTLKSKKKNNFCDEKCRTRYYAIKRYNEIKNHPDYKAYRKEYFKKWLEKNRDRFNELMRPVSRRYQTEQRAKNKRTRIKVEAPKG
jgi:hypothetical protein